MLRVMADGAVSQSVAARVRAHCVAMGTSEPIYEVVWPKSALGVQRRRAALRLAGARRASGSGSCGTTCSAATSCSPCSSEELRRRYDGLEVVGYDTFGNIHGPHEHALIEALPGTLDEHSIDAVVVGNGC